MIDHESRWAGRWIWCDGDGADRNVYVLFRRAFRLPAPAPGARLRISACSRYRLWVDGTHRSDGPPKSQPWLTYYDEHDLGDALDEGEHVVCVIVHHVGYDDDSRGGLLVELRNADGSVIEATGSDWRVQRSSAWRQDSFFCFFNRAVPYQEHFDARALPEDWLARGYDDGSWQPATVVSSRDRSRPPQALPWSRLVRRDIPMMTERIVRAHRIESEGEHTCAMNRMRGNDLSISLSQPGRPVERATVQGVESLLTADGSAVFQCSTTHREDPSAAIDEPYVVLDFGRIVNAYLELDIEGPPGATIEIGYAERLLDGAFNNVVEGQFADSYTTAGGRRVWRNFDWKAFRYLKLRVKSAFEPILVRDLRAIETSYPFEERGRFECPDELLQSVFGICRYTVQIACNEYITDTPWREQGQWLGDVSAVTLGAIYACYGDTALARKFLVQSAATQYATGFLGNMTNTYTARWQGVHVDYSLWWLIAVRDYYCYSGDESIVHELYGVCLRLIEAILPYRNSAGLVEDMAYTVLIDWADIDRTGMCAALNALLAGALDAMAQLALVRGDGRGADDARSARDAITESFSRVFWDAGASLFHDAVDGDRPTGRYSEHAQAAAILFGLATSDQADAVIARLWERGDNFREGSNNGVTEAQPFFTSVVLRALSAAGRSDLAIGVIRDRWGRRMVDRGARSTYEEWSRFGSWRSGTRFLPIMRTESHAWSAYPARWLIEHLAGIAVTAPGCAAVTVDPVRTPFDYRVAFPTPRGTITVEQSGDVTVASAPSAIALSAPSWVDVVPSR